jgi:hypothetical protein
MVFLTQVNTYTLELRHRVMPLNLPVTGPTILTLHVGFLFHFFFTVGARLGNESFGFKERGKGITKPLFWVAFCTIFTG